MTSKIACFRLDIDTLRCLGEGVPYLIKAANPHNAQLTFFLNAGRSIRYRDLLFKGKSKDPIKKIPASKKLGGRYLLKTLLFNPFLYKAYPHNIQEICNEDHELGLHGGRNHGEWMRNAKYWPLKKLQNEIYWGKINTQELTQLTNINSFCSPGWQSPDNLAFVLIEHGFTIIADQFGQHSSFRYKNQLVHFPTHLVGEPGGVGYFEHLYASGLSSSNILLKFERDLKKLGEFAVFYDHPCFIGGLKKDLTPGIFSVLSDNRYKVMSFSNATNELLKSNLKSYRSTSP